MPLTLEQRQAFDQPNLTPEQKDLFSHVKLILPEDLSIWRETFPTPAKSPAGCARSLYLHRKLKSVTKEDIDWIQESFTNVEKLTVYTNSPFAPLYGILPAIKFLQLGWDILRFQDVFGFICSFPLLQDLHIFSGDFFKEKDEAIEDSDEATEEKDGTIEDKDETIKDKDEAIEDKDEAIEDKDGTISQSADWLLPTGTLVLEYGADWFMDELLKPSNKFCFQKIVHKGKRSDRLSSLVKRWSGILQCLDIECCKSTKTCSLGPAEGSASDHISLYRGPY